MSERTPEENRLLDEMLCMVENSTLPENAKKRLRWAIGSSRVCSARTESKRIIFRNVEIEDDWRREYFFRDGNLMSGLRPPQPELTDIRLELELNLPALPGVKYDLMQDPDDDDRFVIVAVTESEERT